ncbi:MAG: hypothetical protein WKF77_10820 [Planctomycetaceae bacterium]
MSQFLVVFVRTLNKHRTVHQDEALQPHFSELALSVTASGGIHISGFLRMENGRAFPKSDK